MSDSPFKSQAPNGANAQKMENVSAASGFEVPVESIVLPSRGILYSAEHPFCNAESVEIKCMTAKEEDLLTSRALIKNGTVISKLLQSCLMNKSVDVDDLLTGDRNAILFAIRVSGYGADYDVKVNCESCGEEFENTFMLSQLTVKPLGAEPLEPNVNAFSFTLPVSKMEVVFKLLTANDEIMMEEEEKRAKKKLGAVNDKLVTSKLYYSILSLNGVTDRQKIAYSVNNLRAKDSRELRKYMAKIEPGINMKQNATCPHCAEENEYDIPLSLNFFWPGE